MAETHAGSEITIIGAGRVITALRQKAGMSIAELGRQINVSRSMMSRYESNERALTLDILEKLAKEFEVTKEQLVFSCLQVAYPGLKTSRIGKTLSLIIEALG